MTTTDVTTTPTTTTSLADVGLLILRIGVGATMIQAGLRKAFDFASSRRDLGYSRVAGEPTRR